jgi:hypothetical protein
MLSVALHASHAAIPMLTSEFRHNEGPSKMLIEKILIKVVKTVLSFYSLLHNYKAIHFPKLYLIFRPP